MKNNNSNNFTVREPPRVFVLLLLPCVFFIVLMLIDQGIHAALLYIAGLVILVLVMSPLFLYLTWSAVFTEDEIIWRKFIKKHRHMYSQIESVEIINVIHGDQLTIRFTDGKKLNIHNSCKNYENAVNRVKRHTSIKRGR